MRTSQSCVNESLKVKMITKLMFYGLFLFHAIAYHRLQNRIYWIERKKISKRPLGYLNLEIFLYFHPLCEMLDLDANSRIIDLSEAGNEKRLN